MDKIETYCPKCDSDITITAKDLLRSIQRKEETGGIPLVSCPECCRVLIIPDAPKDEVTLAAWEPSVSDLICVAFLDDTALRTPNGLVNDLGVKKYTAGSGETGLSRLAYMHKYGINPECYLAKNPSMGGKPFKVSK